MTSLPALRSASDHAVLRKWLSRAFVASILVYVIVMGYLVVEAVTGANKWAPYGVSMPVFIGLIIASEAIVAATAVWIFKEDSGIWPASIADGWSAIRSGRLWSGAKQIAVGAWDVPLIELRLHSRSAILAGRVNRIAALAPLAYILLASAGSSVPWGLRGSALFDVALTVAVWVFMEAVMVRPQSMTAVDGRISGSVSAVAAPAAIATRESRYEVRPVQNRDIPRLLELEAIKWREQGATRETIEARLKNFPQGQLAVEHLRVENGIVGRRSVVAWTTVMAIEGDKVSTFGTWDQVSGGGTLSTCDPKGDTVVGVNLTSVTNGATYLVLGELLASVVEWGKAKFIGGGRLNGFVAFNEHRVDEGRRPFAPGEYAALREIRGHRINELRIEQGLPVLPDPQYVALVNAQLARDGKDPLADDIQPDYVCANIRGYLSIPGSYIVELIPGYFPDPASDDWGVVIAWNNPLPRALRGLPVLKSLVANRIRSEVSSEWDSRKQRVRDRAREQAASRRSLRAATTTVAEEPRQLAAVS